MTTTLTVPRAPAAVVEQTRLRALALQIEFVLRHTTSLEHWLPQMNYGLENRWLWQFGIFGLERDSRARALLLLDIDWGTHDAERSSGRFVSTADESPQRLPSNLPTCGGPLRSVRSW